MIEGDRGLVVWGLGFLIFELSASQFRCTVIGGLFCKCVSNLLMKREERGSKDFRVQLRNLAGEQLALQAWVSLCGAWHEKYCVNTRAYSFAHPRVPSSQGRHTCCDCCSFSFIDVGSLTLPAKLFLSFSLQSSAQTRVHA